MKTIQKNTKSTIDLITYFQKIKQIKQSVYFRLSQNINKNNQLIQSHRLIRSLNNQKSSLEKQKSIKLLQKKLKYKKNIDESNQQKLNKMKRQSQNQKQQLKKKIQQIQQRNIERQQQIKNIQKNIVNKIINELNKNQTKEKHLTQLYNKIKKQQNKLINANLIQNKQQTQEWIKIKKQKWKIQQLTLQHIQKQQQLIKQKNPMPIKKQKQKQKQSNKMIPNQKQYQKLKTPAKIDPKDMGNHYLQQAKLLQRQQISKMKKKKYLNINLKMINYVPQVMQRIYRNTSDLSKTILKSKQEIIPNNSQLKRNQSVPIKKLTSKQFNIQDDAQTQFYLKKIKQNIQQIQRIKDIKQNQNKKQLNNLTQIDIMPLTINS